MNRHPLFSTLPCQKSDLAKSYNVGQLPRTQSKQRSASRPQDMEQELNSHEYVSNFKLHMAGPNPSSLALMPVFHLKYVGLVTTGWFHAAISSSRQSFVFFAKTISPLRIAHLSVNGDSGGREFLRERRCLRTNRLCPSVTPNEEMFLRPSCKARHVRRRTMNIWD